MRVIWKYREFGFEQYLQEPSRLHCFLALSTSLATGFRSSPAETCCCRVWSLDSQWLLIYSLLGHPLGVRDVEERCSVRLGRGDEGSVRSDGRPVGGLRRRAKHPQQDVLDQRERLRRRHGLDRGHGRLHRQRLRRWRQVPAHRGHEVSTSSFKNTLRGDS